MTDDNHNWDRRPEASELLSNIRAAQPELEALLAESSSDWGEPDHVYRYYHQSWKVFTTQSSTERIVTALRALAPQGDSPPRLNARFEEIVLAGTGKKFADEHNRHWAEVTRPMLEAFFHARFFLEMVCKYGRELERPPNLLPNGWAAVLYLYGLR
jgi:hypothetical protein